jgi:hypothetical protein
LRFGQNVVEADGIIWTLSELVGGGAQYLLPSRIGSLVG